MVFEDFTFQEIVKNRVSSMAKGSFFLKGKVFKKLVLSPIYFSEMGRKSSFQLHIPLSLIPRGGVYGQREGDTRTDYRNPPGRDGGKGPLENAIVLLLLLLLLLSPRRAAES